MLSEDQQVGLHTVGIKIHATAIRKRLSTFDLHRNYAKKKPSLLKKITESLPENSQRKTRTSGKYDLDT